MLKTHLDSLEDVIVSKSKVAGHSGHSLHKGTPREIFIKEFLESHLGEDCAIGSGEIIDCDSRPGESRNQHDIIIYRRSFPKLDFGAGICAFMVESVVATIEIKSYLDKSGLRNAIKAANKTKGLSQSYDPILHGEIEDKKTPKDIQCYVIAYEGYKDLRLVCKQIMDIHKALHISTPHLPTNRLDSQAVMSNSIDGVFILKQGFVMFANQPVYFQAQVKLDDDNEQHSWVMANQEYGNLAILFLILLDRINNSKKDYIMYPVGYLKNHIMGDIYHD